MNEPTTTIVGNATDDPALRFLTNGRAVTSVKLACTPRIKDGQEWKDGETWFVRVTAWGDDGEALANSVQKGQKVIAHGRLSVNRYEHNGEQRESIEMTAENVGLALTKFQTARAHKADRGSGGFGQQQADPWASGPATGAQKGWGDESPF